ncbi:hypothetical protein [Paenibacillus xylanexedens]|uniref:hypothetical protein n=1 Tax=Paenibacillus xylanexedens TaxID=528191 RepID=UPI0011A2C9E9|nr:hypothetical protein [Paenibacillus xylanexedens]
MSFMLYRSKKLQRNNIQDGEYPAKIVNVEPDKRNKDVWHVQFELANGGIVRNRYVDHPDIISALDYLIFAALGQEVEDLDLLQIIGCYVMITVQKRGMYTNVIRVENLNEKDIEELERHLNDEDTDDLDSSDDDEDEELDEELEDDELDMESWEESEDEDTDDTEDEDAEELQSPWLDPGKRRRRFS